ncbi:ABC transporter G family member 24-like [Diospyros lotus]|uniref:ABC transporter G family member 24-like n=1 Tax=Diospyros lotus TaxID=55363 RepID=UPI00224E7ADA|nr:ABC transporter G family member 24-like [Diospyros lotus]XP_052200262.1 ABC transporter G family member 24-like [Diospyros lotus]
MRVRYISAFAAFLLLLSSVWFVRCQVDDGFSQIDDPDVLELVTQLVYSRLSNLTSVILSPDNTKNASFCIKDPTADWDRTFNYSSNLAFLSSCIRRTRGDISRRLCTAAEVKFYFSSFFERRSQSNNYLNLNKNCNLTTWNPGCEPGWACNANPNEQFDLRDSRHVPSRTSDCQPCCEGFFCPSGIACMISCPLGAYCPLARLNKATGMCEPYSYKLPAGKPNHTCGGANIWADVGSSSEMFCSAGSYCPTSIQKIPCSNGHYCRMGSISEKRCFKLTSCNSNTATQNIHAYGVMLIVALSTLLLLIYNCSDQVLATRERRRAKTREAAVRSIREKAKARERWKSAKDAAKKRAIGLQSQFSQTFSRKKTVTLPEQLKILHETTVERDDNSLDSSIQPSTSRLHEQSSAASGGKETEPSDLMKRMHAIDDDSYFDGLSFEVEGKNVKRKMPNEKQIHTHSQIFKYAYAQLEKEKAQQQQNKDLTFSGVISMATNTGIRKRPTIEVSFRELTLTLKGTNRHLLRCVTGRITPGHITAVMGPSGAGKTTFLSSLAGKTVGCKMTGLILINGKTDSIHSYRKITGFVPQDDIVHGNLTVEENLWFSARCRLSAELPKPDKVLIVERVIESLGLQAVRNSLVGTVEKRGISGGQRKRVNVGLELVMEPSLLILDEPTSGLDSSSSQLLLRALRREALEGVNICMVVHQPGYTLFTMFDDLILLAKGGHTVYHGPVRKVEEYFAGLGINVPERANPPDYFIDVLEGMVKLSTNSGISQAELPLKWMLHKGYQVPPDMQKNSAGPAIPVVINPCDHGSSVGAESGEQSFTEEMWQGVISSVERRRDIIRHNFLRPRDSSNRRTPGLFMQYKYFLGRVGKQRMREARILAIDYLILLLAGACLGSLTKVSDQNFGAPGYTYTIIAVSLLCKIAALRSFSLDKLQYWRESASGISSLAHFLAKDTIDHFNTVVKPVVYLSMFYFFSNPRSSFSDNYIILLCLVYCVTGIGYLLVIFLEPGSAQLFAVLLPVVLTLIATQKGENKFLKNLENLCYPKWALEAFVMANAERYTGVWLITRCGALMEMNYNLNDWALCVSFLIAVGVISRVIAFVGMVTFQKK